MRIGVVVDYADEFAAAVALVREAERLGADLVQVSEAYSFDAVSRLGYLAGVTERIGLGSAVLSVFSRSAAALAMTAAGLDEVSGGRFELGLGASGPQVVEGFHGVPFRAPLTRLRETVEACRAVWRREPLVLDGREVTVPLPADRGTGLGKPLTLVNHPVRDRIPISLAALTPRAVAQAAEIAEGWMPVLWWPERAEQAWGVALAEGLSKRPAWLGPLDVQVAVPVAVGTGPRAEAALGRHRARLALYLGGMGARDANFYADLAGRYGFADEAGEVQDRYLAGDRAGAAAAVPDELVHGTCLVGAAEHVRTRLAAFAAAGVTTLSLVPLGGSGSERAADVAAVLEARPEPPA